MGNCVPGEPTSPFDAATEAQYTGSGVCAKCNNYRVLWSVKYDRGYGMVTFEGRCQGCIQLEIWNCLSLKPGGQGQLLIGVGDRKDWRNQATVKTNTVSEAVLQCQVCRGYFRTLHSLHFDKFVLHNPSQVMGASDYVETVYEKTRKLPSVCKSCACARRFNHGESVFIYAK